MKKLIKKLSSKCPFGKNLPDCPMTQAKSDKDSMEELRRDDFDTMMAHHRNCMAKRSNIVSQFEQLLAGYQVNGEAIFGYD